MITPETHKQRKTRSSKPDLLSSDVFIAGLKEKFEETPLVATVDDLAALLNSIILPPKWTVNTTKKELTQLEIIGYSRKKPAGYYLNLDKLDEINQMGVSSEKEQSQNEINDNVIENNISLQIQDDLTTSEKLIDETITEINNKIPSEIIEDINEKQVPSKSNSNNQTLLDKIPAFSNYLLKRMSSDARELLKMGIFEMNSLPSSKLDRNIEHLSSARLFFDINYPKEKELVDFINEKVKYMANIKEKLHEKEAEVIIKKVFISGLNKGKFDKIINQWGISIDEDESAYQILEKFGRKRKNIPLSDFALRKRIVELLLEKYPNKKVDE